MPDTYRLLRPLLFALSANTAHALALAVLRAGIAAPGGRPVADPALAVTVWGRQFANPIGLAAGLDKNAVAIDGLARLGFGAIEVGSVTPRPQVGNPPPNLFRIPGHEALINRMGFNNEGHAAMADRLRTAGAFAIPVGVNLGCNRDSEDPRADYRAGVVRFAPLADYLVVNVSSPNTPGLRDWQGRDRLRDLLNTVLGARNEVRAETPLLVKIAPDLDDRGLADIVEVCGACGVDGMIVSNTTTARPDDLPESFRGLAGGLSGRPLMAPSTRLLAEVARMTGGTMPLIGVGGIFSAADVYEKMRAGASLVQLYTALIYRGPGLVRRILQDLRVLMERDGIRRIGDVVGTGL